MPLALPLGELASLTGLDGEGARRQPYFKVSSVMRNFPTMPKAPSQRELAKPQALTEGVHTPFMTEL